MSILIIREKSAGVSIGEESKEVCIFSIREESV